VGFSAKAVSEERSFMSNRLGAKVMSELVTITDDALAPHAMGTTFDFEGQPRIRTTIVNEGVAVTPVTDSYWAAKLATRNTGHALPAPNSWGPMPMNLEMAPGDSSLSELIGSVTRGVYVTRFHYVNVEDPVPVTLTGMTRDGTFLIENGRLTHPLKNLRFTQSAVEALAHCEGVTRERQFIGTEESAVYVPGLLLAKFAFTGQTS
jgi:PmbA protein